MLNGRKPEPLAAAAKALTDAGLRASTSRVRRDQRQTPCAPASAAIEREHGRLDILVNNAGIQRRNPLVDFKRQDWDDIIATNLTAPFLVAQAVLPGMIARRSGKIINIASLMSELARPTVVPYTAAKGGVRQLTRGMAVELAPHNIQVNAISPGYFATEMNRALIDNAEFNAWVCKRTPAGRWGEPSEIAGLAVFLCLRRGELHHRPAHHHRRRDECGAVSGEARRAGANANQRLPPTPDADFARAVQGGGAVRTVSMPRAAPSRESSPWPTRLRPTA